VCVCVIEHIYTLVHTPMHVGVICYLQEAVDFMINHDQVQSGGIGTIAVSKGTEFISYMAIYSPMVIILILL